MADPQSPTAEQRWPNTAGSILRVDQFSVANGHARFECPYPLSAADREDVSDWLLLILKRLEREGKKVAIEPPSGPESEEPK